MIANSPADILRFALARMNEGVATALVTLTGIEGSSSRAIGAQMAVASDGRYVGSFSGGCIEAAVAAEAVATFADGQPRLVRYGANSPYFDIRLPCGGGIDLLFTPNPDAQALADTLAALDRRERASLSLPGAEGSDRFVLRLTPALRILAFGQGEELSAFALLARNFGADVCALSPDRAVLASLTDQGIETVELITRTQLPPVQADAWTAAIFLFHDRDWEEYLLPAALALPGFYIGAIGSPKTQATRREMLRAAGVPDALSARLQPSVGLIPATRDPATLALSALAQIVQLYPRE